MPSRNKTKSPQPESTRPLAAKDVKRGGDTRIDKRHPRAAQLHPVSVAAAEQQASAKRKRASQAEENPVKRAKTSQNSKSKPAASSRSKPAASSRSKPAASS
eukprot:761503-Hanusia_phi.AAC.1